jgi:hypothetical protein
MCIVLCRVSIRLSVDGRVLEESDAPEIPFNSAEILEVFIKKRLAKAFRRARDRPHSRDWERVALLVTGHEGEPPQLPPVLRVASGEEEGTGRQEGEGQGDGERGSRK